MPNFLDYGSHPDSVSNGTFGWEGRYTINAIAVYDGRTVRVPPGLMLVDGSAIVYEQRTVGSRRVPVVCKTDSKVTGQGTPSSPRHVSVSRGGVSVDPGPGLPWTVGCTATESLPKHNLPGGPGFTVPAPAKSLFTRTQAFSIGCQDSYDHPYDRPGLSNGHACNGRVRYWVRFTPFPESKLPATKQALRDKLGLSLSAALGKRSLKNC